MQPVMSTIEKFRPLVEALQLFPGVEVTHLHQGESSSVGGIDPSFVRFRYTQQSTLAPAWGFYLRLKNRDALKQYSAVEPVWFYGGVEFQWRLHEPSIPLLAEALKQLALEDAGSSSQSTE